MAIWTDKGIWGLFAASLSACCVGFQSREPGEG